MLIYINNGNDELRPWYSIGESKSKAGVKMLHIIPFGDCVTTTHLHTIEASIVNKGFISAGSGFAIDYPFEEDFQQDDGIIDCEVW